MTTNPCCRAHTLRFLPTLFLALALTSAPERARAQVESVTVSKGYSYVQSSATTVTLSTEGNNYSFNADVNGQNIAGITPPTLSGPINTGALGASFNGGVLKYSAGDRGWRSGTNADDFGFATLAGLNSVFGNGAYSFTVNGATLPLSLAGDAYPNAPSLTLTGGAWRDGTYVFDPAQPLTITTNAFTAYGTHPEALICMLMVGGSYTLPFQSVAPFGCAFGLARQFRSQVPGSNSLSHTIPANTLVSGQEYTLGAGFQAIVDGHTDAALPGSMNFAYYEAFTTLTLKAETAVFPMVVTGSIGPTVSNITASIQYRPADVGTTGSVYSFAVAPATLTLPPLLKDAADALPPLGYAKTRDGRKDTTVACVLAQLNASGQLRQVSASSLQAFVSGVLGAQGQAIAVINGVATATIAGTTFYVGYGTSAQSMLNTGVNRHVVAVPGALECKPQPPQTGWWWNPQEGGRGYSIESQGNHIFYAAFLYDDTGRSNWYVATGTTSIDGSLFTGDLLRVVNGQALGGAYRPPAAATSAGPFTLAFTGATTGTMVWPGGAVAIERFNIVPNGLVAPKRSNQPETGWWWNPAESGRGFFIEWQDGTADLAGYMYDDAGNAVWYLTVVTTPDMRALSSSWWLYANGQSLTGAYRPATRINDNVAPVTISFTSATTGTMTLPNGRTTNLVRHRF